MKILKETKVNTTVVKSWDSKPYLCFNEYCKEWFLFLSVRDTRRMKKIMKLAKDCIKLEESNVRILFKVRNYNYYLNKNA